jgi:hypothetical protein
MSRGGPPRGAGACAAAACPSRGRESRSACGGSETPRPEGHASRGVWGASGIRDREGLSGARRY